MKTYKIAVIPGDGVGPEVLKEGMKVLKRAAECSGAFSFEGYLVSLGLRVLSGAWADDARGWDPDPGALTPFIWARWAIPGCRTYFPVGSSFEDPEKL